MINSRQEAKPEPVPQPPRTRSPAPQPAGPGPHSAYTEWHDSESYAPGLGPVTDDCGIDTCCATPCMNGSFWARAEYLLWWTQELNVPALVTTSPAGTPQAQAGVLGQAGTTVLFGNNGLLDDDRSGGRFTVGLWLDPSRCRGFDVTYLKLEDEAESFRGSNAQFPILARPFFNLTVGAEDSRLIAFPGQIQGSLAIQTSSEFQTLEALYRRKTSSSFCQQTAIVFGYRYAELEDRIRIDETTVALAGPLVGTTFNLFDQFNSTNTFHGAEAGLEIQWQPGQCWSWDALAKIAVGETTARTDIAGQTTTTVAGGAPATARGGLLALPTNIGTFEQSDLSAICELGLSVRRQLCRDLTATVGYSCLLWTSVERAGEQIDRTINATQVPPGVLVGEPRPAFPLELSTYWAQGLRFGLEYAY